MKKENIFYLLIAVFSLFLFLLLIKVINVRIDKYSLILLFAFIGISLLPFLEKLKIGSVLEIERLKEKVDEVKVNQFLGEVIKSSRGEIYFFDSDGKHKIPDFQTAVFLRSSKGEILVSDTDLRLMKTAYPFESVLNAKTISWNGHIFVLLNEKKYHVTSWSFMADWGKKQADEKINDEQIKLIPTGR
jgi:hypothetical protein